MENGTGTRSGKIEVKKYTQEEVNQILDLHQIMMKESKDSVLQQKFAIRFQAKAVLLKWRKGAQNKLGKEKLLSDLDSISQMMSLMDELEGENNGLRMKLYYSNRENDALRHFESENQKLKQGIRDLTNELDRVVKMKMEEFKQ